MNKCDRKGNLNSQYFEVLHAHTEHWTFRNLKLFVFDKRLYESSVAQDVLETGHKIKIYKVELLKSINKRDSVSIYRNKENLMNRDEVPSKMRFSNIFCKTTKNTFENISTTFFCFLCHENFWWTLVCPIGSLMNHQWWWKHCFQNVQSVLFVEIKTYH